MSQYPSTYFIETVLGCNLSCPECAVGGGLVRRKYGMMPLERFKQIADKIQDHCKYMYLYIWGEPMLNPHIYEMIRYAGKFSRTNISTNANTLTEQSAKMLVDTGVTDIFVSIDGMTQDCYSIYRKGGDVNHVLKALEWLAKYSGAALKKNFFLKILRKIIWGKKKRAHVIPQFVVFRHNEHEMEMFAEFCSKLGLKDLYFKDPYLREGSSLELAGDPKYHRTIFSADTETRKINMKSCTSMTDTLIILLDGSVVCCCYDHDGMTSFGNILESTMEEILDSEKYRAFRQGLASGNPPGFCMKNCLTF